MRFLVSAWLVCAFSVVSWGQQIVPLQFGFNSVVNGICPISDSTLLVYGFFEKASSDSGYFDQNAILIHKDGRVLRRLKFTDREQAEIHHVYKSVKGNQYFAWSYQEPCESGARGNYVIRIDKSLSIEDSVFYVEHNHTRVRPLAGDLLDLGGNGWFTTYDSTALFLSPRGATKRDYKLDNSPLQIVSQGDSAFLFRGVKSLLAGNGEKAFAPAQTFSDTLVDLVPIAGSLFALASKKTLIYVNILAETKFSFGSSTLGLDRIDKLDYHNNLIYVFGKKGDNLVVKTVDDLDQVQNLGTIGHLEPRDVVTFHYRFGDKHFLAIRRQQQDQRFDFVYVWNENENNAPSEYGNMTIEDIGVEFVKKDVSKYPNVPLMDIRLKVNITIANAGEDTLTHWQTHHKGVFNERCDNNLTTIETFAEVAPGKLYKYHLVLTDQAVEEDKHYPLCLSVTLPNGRVDTMLIDNTRCWAQDLGRTFYEKTQHRVQVYPTLVGESAHIYCEADKEVIQLRLLGMNGRVVKEVRSNMPVGQPVRLEIEGIKKGFYLVEASLSDGYVFYKKVILDY